MMAFSVKACPICRQLLSKLMMYKQMLSEVTAVFANGKIDLGNAKIERSTGGHCASCCECIAVKLFRSAPSFVYFFIAPYSSYHYIYHLTGLSPQKGLQSLSMQFCVCARAQLATHKCSLDLPNTRPSPDNSYISLISSKSTMFFAFFLLFHQTCGYILFCLNYVFCRPELYKKTLFIDNLPLIHQGLVEN